MTTQSLQQAIKHRYNKQPNNTRQTQIGHQGNLCWNCACQIVVVESQASCRMNMMSKHESK